MKNLKLLLLSTLFLCLAQNSFSAFVYTNPVDDVKPKKSHTISEMDRLAMKQFVSLTPGQYGTIRGKKLSFFEKIEFKICQKKLRRKLADNSSGFNAGGFFLGFLLGLLGIILAYIFSRDRNFRKWALYGWLSWVAIILIIVAASGGGLD